MSSIIIEGPRIIVEIDETKLGKRKYNKGHPVEGAWVICGVERTKEKKYFAIQVENRDSATIKDILSKYVSEGSIIFTDKWRAYKKPCEELGFEHYTVNHSLHFKDPITGVHTNTIEGYNNSLKSFIQPRNRTKKHIRGYLGFYI